MDKKHPNKFTIVFNTADSRQAFAAEYLNELPYRSVAMFVAQAVSAYINGDVKPAKTKRGVSPQQPAEKRRRGRPRKMPLKNTVATTGNEGPRAGTVQTPLSHIQTSEALDLEHSSETNTGSGVKPADAGMLGSMMDFIGRS